MTKNNPEKICMVGRNLRKFLDDGLINEHDWINTINEMLKALKNEVKEVSREEFLFHCGFQ